MEREQHQNAINSQPWVVERKKCTRINAYINLRVCKKRMCINSYMYTCVYIGMHNFSTQEGWVWDPPTVSQLWTSHQVQNLRIRIPLDKAGREEPGACQHSKHRHSSLPFHYPQQLGRSLCFLPRQGPGSTVKLQWSPLSGSPGRGGVASG